MPEVPKPYFPVPVRRLRREPERTVSVEFVPVDAPALQAAKTASILRIFRSALIRRAGGEKSQGES